MCKFSDNVSGHLDNLISLKDIGSLQRLGWYLLKYDKYREILWLIVGDFTLIFTSLQVF